MRRLSRTDARKHRPLPCRRMRAGIQPQDRTERRVCADRRVRGTMALTERCSQRDVTFVRGRCFRTIERVKGQSNASNGRFRMHFLGTYAETPPQRVIYRRVFPSCRVDQRSATYHPGAVLAGYASLVRPTRLMVRLNRGRVMGIQVIESAGADIPSRRMHRDPHTQQVLGLSAQSRVPQSFSTAIRADIGESKAYKQALIRGEIGLQRPLGANVSRRGLHYRIKRGTDGDQGDRLY